MSIKRFFLCLLFTATAVWSHCYGDPPEWRVDSRCFLDGPPGAFDDIAVKDPSIVYSGNKWHLFYTGRDVDVGGNFRMGYASATYISELNGATRYYLSSLDGGNYFCAPQVFWFEEKDKWYLIYQSGLGPTFSTNTDINNPDGWAPGIGMGFSGGVVDYWCISDGNDVYCFYSPLGTTILRRRTTVADFPYNWSAETTVATDTFEAPHVYKSKADGQYYMMVEDITRHFELWTASSLGGTWTKVEEQWAHRDHLIYFADHWTDQVSHGEILRAGINERMEISDINHCEILIQGVADGNYGDYGNIPYDLGIIRQCPAGPGDLNLDCDVDFEDFAVLALQWQQSPGVPSADIVPPGGDGIVDLNDLGLLVDSWLWPLLNPDYSLPVAPTGLVATAASEMVLLDWDDNNEPDLVGYNVYRSLTGGSGYTKINSSLVSDSNHTDDNVITGTPYYYVVTAVDNIFNESEYSNEASATPFDITPPAPPTGLTASVANNTVLLYWNNNTEDDVNGYNVYRSTVSGSGYSKINVTLLSDPNYTDNDVNNGTPYYYVVTAVDMLSNESDYSSEVEATPTLPVIYTFAGITPPDTNYNAYACDVDVFPFYGDAANRNSQVEATVAQYSNISAPNDAAKWTIASPGIGDEVFLWVEMKINESLDSISRIDLTFYGNSGTSGSVSHGIYVMKAGADWKLNDSWVQVGSGQSIPAGVNTEMSRTITLDVGTYINGTGKIVWGVYETTSNVAMNIDYLEMGVYVNVP